MTAYARSLTGTALAYTVLHHLGLLPGGLGDGPHGTQWVDWLDLAVPWLVLVPAALALRSAKTPPRWWAVFGAGALAYTSGHGIHLAANSIANQARGPTAHLWDEVVGHQLWYAGCALVAASLTATMVGRPRPGWAAHLLAVGVGITWGTNAVGGGTLAFSSAVAVAAAAVGWAHRRDLRAVLLTAAVSSLAVMLVEVLSPGLAG